MQTVLEILKEQKDMQLKGNLYHKTQVAFCYNTNHIEGSTLTEEQTKYIFETNSFIQDEDTAINVDDVVEAVNHFRLFDYMIDIAKEPLTENMIKEFHKILKTSTSDSRKEWFNVGEYKKLPNEVGSITTAKPDEVAQEIKKLLDWYNSLKTVSINDVIKFHSDFEKIHPFQDGNRKIWKNDCI